MNTSPGSMRFFSAWTLFGLIGVSAFCGCAPLSPIPFELVDRGQVYQGTLSRSDRRIEVDIGGKHFQGYYLLASGTAHFHQGGWWRRPFPNEITTSFVSNSARATLVASDGERLVCEFIVEDSSAIGECKSTKGQTYQLVTAVQ